MGDSLCAARGVVGEELLVRDRPQLAFQRQGVVVVSGRWSDCHRFDISRFKRSFRMLLLGGPYRHRQKFFQFHQFMIFTTGYQCTVLVCRWCLQLWLAIPCYLGDDSPSALSSSPPRSSRSCWGWWCGRVGRQLANHQRIAVFAFHSLNKFQSLGDGRESLEPSSAGVV